MSYGTINGIDTTQAAWQAYPTKPVNLAGWLRQSAFNYLCDLAGVAQNTQSTYADRPLGPYDTTNSTEDLLVATSNCNLQFNAGYKLATLFYAVSVACGTVTLTSANPTITPDVTPSMGGISPAQTVGGAL